MIDQKIISSALKGLTPRLDGDSLDSRLAATLRFVFSSLWTGVTDRETAERDLKGAVKSGSFNHGLHRRRIAVLEASLVHLETAKKALELGSLALRPRDVSVQSPGLRCHEIYEQLRTDCAPLLSNMGDLMEVTDKSPIRVDLRKIADATKFDLRRLRQKDVGPNADFAQELRNKGLFRPPFDLCWYEWEIMAGPTIGVLHQWNEHIEQFEWWARVDRAGWARWRAVAMPEGDAIFDSAIKRVLDATIVILLSRCGERLPVLAPERLNHHRAKAGRGPIFSHTIVEVRALHIDRDGKETMIRRSPRQHWRRGHIRRLRDANGVVRREIPLAPFLVGSLRHGKISHDYIVEPRSAD
jgi:hypothetical protein